MSPSMGIPEYRDPPPGKETQRTLDAGGVLVRAFTRDVLRRDSGVWPSEWKQCLDMERGCEETETSGGAAEASVGGPGSEAARRVHDVKYALQFPATLRIITDNNTTFRTTPEEAWAWLENRGINQVERKSSSQSTRQEGFLLAVNGTHGQALLENKRPKRVQVLAEMELRAGPPPSPELREEQQDVDPPALDKEQMHVILGNGPLVTPQTAEDVL
ncbi:hypothetical protein NDU88_004656 [Pleurodeles waltl]|uniref:Integrase catalytic domain-containing protein n=1 Tax=Pleurodeles waltl TaxID=8319 RepID=A0AAV7VKX4_PLEWA|nr:hypothetical protein NDU88_004656 [Pleurodeles waltl]